MVHTVLPLAHVPARGRTATGLSTPPALFSLKPGNDGTNWTGVVKSLR